MNQLRLGDISQNLLDLFTGLSQQLFYFLRRIIDEATGDLPPSAIDTGYHFTSTETALHAGYPDRQQAFARRLEDFDSTLGCDLHVRRFQVAMDDSALVSVFQGVSDLFGDG